MTAKISTILDTFALDQLSSLWSNSIGTLSVSSGKCSIQVDTSYSSKLISTNTYDLTGSKAYVSVTPYIASSAQIGLELFLDASNKLQLFYSGTVLQAHIVQAGVDTTVASITYDSTVHIYWRIRELSGTIFWDTSQNGKSWTNIGSHSYTIAITSLSFSVFAGDFGTDPTGTAFINSVNMPAGLSYEYSDLYLDTYTGLYGQISPSTQQVWPYAGALAVKVELLLNGTWTEITPYCYQRDLSVGLDITFGRQDESSTITNNPSQCKLQLNNRNGIFSSKNTSSPFYPFITRNTQLRVSFQADYNGSDAGYVYQFWGEVPAWPPSWDVTGNDVWVDIEASGIIRRLNRSGSLGSTLYRFYTVLKSTSDPTTPVAYWPCNEGMNATQFVETTGNGSAGTFTGTPTLASDDSFTGSDPIPVLNGSSWVLLTGSYADPGVMTYSNPGSYLFTPRGGLSTLTSAECWGAGGGGTNGYKANSNEDSSGGGGEYAKETSVDVSTGGPFSVTVGSGGHGGVLSKTQGNAAADGSDSSFTGSSVTVTAHGGKGGTLTIAGVGGTGSTNTTHHNGGNGARNSGSFYGGSGGGSSGGTSAAGNNGSAGGGSNTGASGGTAVTGGGAGGKGGNGGAGVDNPGTTGSVPGGGGGSGGENSNNKAAHSGGNGGAGKVKLTWTPLASPDYNVTRFLLHVPTTGDTNNAVVARVKSSGKVAKLDLVYTTASNGGITLKGYDSVGTLLFTSATLTDLSGINGLLLLVSLELKPGIGGGVAYAFEYQYFTGSLSSRGHIDTGPVSASGAVGVVSEIDVNPDGALIGSSAGGFVVQYSEEDIGIVSSSVLGGWDGELAGSRFERLCGEVGVSFTIAGDITTTPAMGPQPNDKFINVLQQIEDLDRGLLSESRNSFGFKYRTYSNLTNQKPHLILDYSKAMLSPPFQPTEDDLLTRNIVTVSRLNGSSVVVSLDTGAMSTQDPPNGVGEYTYPISVNAHSDSLLAACANKILALGTVDDYRYPQATLELTRSQLQGVFGIINSLAIGDYTQVLSPPSTYLTSSTIKQLVYGFTISAHAKKFTFTLNWIPESPFEV